jgi:hypothetical protein
LAGGAGFGAGACCGCVAAGVGRGVTGAAGVVAVAAGWDGGAAGRGTVCRGGFGIVGA